MADTYSLRASLFSHAETSVGESLLWLIAADVLHWWGGSAKVTPRDVLETDEVPPAGRWTGTFGTLRIDSFRSNEGFAWRLRWTAPDRSDFRLAVEWLTEVKLATFGEDVEFDIDIKAASTLSTVQPEVPRPAPPRLVGTLFSGYRAFVLGQRVDPEPHRIEAHNVAVRLVPTLLDEKRTLPVVVVSRAPSGFWPVPPERIASTVAGFADVFALEDSEAAWEVTRELGWQLKCHDGAVRIYWPRIDLESDDSYRHGYWLPQRIDGSFPLSILYLLHRRAEHLFAGQTTYWSQIRESFEQLRISSLDLDAAVQLLAEASEVEKANVARIRELEIEGALSQQAIEELQTELDAVRRSFSDIYRNESSRPASLSHDKLNSAVDVIESITSSKLRIRFLRSAAESAAECPEYDWDRIRSTFVTFDELAGILQSNEPVGMRLEHWLKMRGVDYVPFISETSEGKWGKDYTFMDHNSGRQLQMPGHVRFGQYVRLHLEWSAVEHKWVVGWLGKHRTNTMS